MKIHTGAAVVDVIPARGRDLAVFGVARIAIEPDRLVGWMRHVDLLHRSSYIPIARRFATPPGIDDVRELVLDDQDLDDLRECRPGSCGLKLAAPEIVQIRQAIATAGIAWRGAAQAAFRRVIVNRAQSYATAGHAGTPPYHDHKVPVSPDAEFAALTQGMELESFAPAYVGQYLAAYPRAVSSDVESFLYWSKETLGGSKPIVAITHVSIFDTPGQRAITVAFKQVYASHYLTASLSLTGLIGGADAVPQYLVYARRSRADVFGGAFGGLVRRLIERRVKAEAPAALDGLRRRLESEPPDGEGSS